MKYVLSALGSLFIGALTFLAVAMYLHDSPGSRQLHAAIGANPPVAAAPAPVLRDAEMVAPPEISAPAPSPLPRATYRLRQNFTLAPTAERRAKTFEGVPGGRVDVLIESLLPVNASFDAPTGRCDVIEGGMSCELPEGRWTLTIEDARDRNEGMRGVIGLLIKPNPQDVVRVLKQMPDNSVTADIAAR